MGMSNRIGRKVTENVCHCIVVDKHNNTTRQDVVLYGDYSNDVRANNAVRRKLHSTRVLIESVETREFYASMPIEQFIKDADQITER